MGKLNVLLIIFYEIFKSYNMKMYYMFYIMVILYILWIFSKSFKM